MLRYRRIVEVGILKHRRVLHFVMFLKLLNPYSFFVYSRPILMDWALANVIMDRGMNTVPHRNLILMLVRKTNIRN